MQQDTRIEVVRIHRFENGGPVKAFADIQFNEEYVVKGFRLVEGKEGMFIGMPCEAGKSGKWFDTFLPLSDDIKNRIFDAVLKAYEE